MIEFLKLDPSDGILQLDAPGASVQLAWHSNAHRPHTVAAVTRGHDVVRGGFGHRECAGQAGRRTGQSNVVRYRQRIAAQLIAARLQRAADLSSALHASNSNGLSVLVR